MRRFERSKISPGGSSAMASSSVPARYLAWCGLVIAGCSVPVLLSTHPPLYDYPFYIARLFILTELPISPFLSEHYSASSFLIPNIGMELVLLPLTSILPLEVAFDVFLILIFTSIITGTVFLHRTLFDQTSLWPLVSGVFVVNWIFLFGFLTYLLGVGLFLWAIAAWIRLSRELTRYRFLYGSVIAVGLFFVHLVAFGLYAVAVFGFEIQRVLMSVHGQDRRSLSSAVRTMAYSGVQFVIPVILYLMSSTRNTGVAEGIGGIHYEFAKKLATPIVTLTSGIPWLDVLMGLTVVSSALIVFFAGRIRISTNIMGAGICLILVYLALPHILKPAAFVDTRLPIAMLFFLIGSLKISFPKKFGGMMLVAIIATFFVVKTIAVTRQWQEHDTLIEEYFQAFDRIEEHSTMFIAMQDVPPSWVRKHYLWRVGSPTHVADLATLTGRIFAPAVFALSGQHTIATREKFAELKAYQSVEPIRIADAEAFARVVGELRHLHVRVSPDRAAYLLLQDRGEDPMPLVEGVRLITSGNGFRLVQIYEPG